MNDHPESLPAAQTRRPEMELSQLDLRYEGHRLRQRGLEDRILASIAREGIREPLAGAVVESVCVLLDGFKRYRCARQLHVQRVPFVTLGVDEASAIVELLGQARRSLGHQKILADEEAKFFYRLNQILLRRIHGEFDNPAPMRYFLRESDPVSRRPLPGSGSGVLPDQRLPGIETISPVRFLAAL